jgi:hypothetical protein
MSHDLVRRGLIGIRELSRPLCGRSIIFIWKHVANMHRIYSSDGRTANRGTGSTRWGLCERWFIGFRGGVERRLERFCIPHVNILVLMNRVLRLGVFFCHRYVLGEMSGRWRRRSLRGGNRVLEERRNDDEKDERMKEKKRRTGDDRSINLRTNGRVVELVETDLVRLVAGVAFNFGNIRTDFHGDVGDGVDGGVRRVGQRGIGVRRGFVVETIRCWEGNCGRVEHCARDRSRDNRGAKRGNWQKTAKDRFQVDGHPNGSLSFYRC